jgi:hypothetical protein
VAAILSCVGFMAIPGPALAYTPPGYIDQQNQTTTSWVQSAYIYAQTFTAAHNGQLAAVWVYLHPSVSSVSVTVNVQGTTGSPPVPNGTVIATQTFGLTSSQNGWVEFLYSRRPAITAGRVYAIGINVGDNVNVMGSGNTYSRGQAMVFSGGHWVSPASVLPGGPSDFSFKEWLVGTAPTPAPTPTRRPAATPTPRPTPTPTPTATATDTSSPLAADATAGFTATPVISIAPTTTPSPAPASAAVDPVSPAGPTAPTSSGDGLSPISIAILLLGLAALVVALMVLAFTLGRKRRQPETP